MRQLPILPLCQPIAQQRRQLPSPVRGLPTPQFQRSHRISLRACHLFLHRPCRSLSQLYCHHQGRVSYRAFIPRLCQHINPLGARPRRPCQPYCQVLCQPSLHDQVQFLYPSRRLYLARYPSHPRLQCQRCCPPQRPCLQHYQRCYRPRFLNLMTV